MVFMHLESKNSKIINHKQEDSFGDLPFMKKIILILGWLFLSLGNLVSFYIIQNGFFVDALISTSMILFFYIMGIFFVFEFF